MGYSPWGRKESDMTERLSTAQHMYTHVCVHMCIYTVIHVYVCVCTCVKENNFP